MRDFGPSVQSGRRARIPTRNRAGAPVRRFGGTQKTNVCGATDVAESAIRIPNPNPESRIPNPACLAGAGPPAVRRRRKPRVPILLSHYRVDDEQLRLGHLLDRVARAFAADARVLHAAVRHVIDAPRRHVVDDDAADLEGVEGGQRVVQIVGEDAGLQAVARAVDRGHGLVEVARSGTAR